MEEGCLVRWDQNKSLRFISQGMWVEKGPRQVEKKNLFVILLTSGYTYGGHYMHAT